MGESSGIVSPLASWGSGGRAFARLRRGILTGRPVLLAARDHAWRRLAPAFPEAVALATSGVPAQSAADRRYDRSGDRRRLGAALAAGATVYLPQVHQVLPRVARLMVALRQALFRPVPAGAREECSFLFVVDGRGRAGMGLHHDGDVDAIWLQLEGSRTVTVGPAVPVGVPEDLDDRLAAAGPRAGWRTRDLRAGTLLYLPPRTPHRVVCHGRSLALTLTWQRPRPGVGGRRAPRTAREALAWTGWDVAAGFATAVPAASPRDLWVQVPLAVGPVDRTGRAFSLWGPGGEMLRLAAALRPRVRRLAGMPRLSGPAASRARQALGPLLARGFLGPRDLPRRLLPEEPRALDGWRFH
jgi:mannose-6-phosphate isomerase-like protein (cupin superfamily)